MRGLIGKSDGRNFRWLALEQPSQPSLSFGVLSHQPDDRGRADDQQAPKIAVALFADPAEPFFAAGTMRARR
jgi:hypothetical protein